MAFPRGTYAKYKRATACFLAWLLRARDAGLGGAVPRERALDMYERVVTAIAKAPVSALSPALLQRWPHAKAACEAAITLRGRVAVFFGAASDAAHAHFLSRLCRWHEMLQESELSAYEAPSKPRGPATGATTAVDFSNYYAVLALPDDYFTEDDDTPGTKEGEPVLPFPALSKAARKKLQDDAFVDDLHTELACMLMELEELSEGVYAVFLDVKRERKTLVEATVVAKVAIASAASVIASFQLRHPTLRNANDLTRLIEDRLSLEQIKRLIAMVQTAWRPSEDPSKIRHQYVPGTILLDIVGISRVLSRLGEDISSPFMPSGDKYDEATTRHYVVPEWGRLLPFFSHHVPWLLNTVMDLDAMQRGVVARSPMAWLLEPFDKFTKTRKTTIHLMFICTCWIRSVAALQGDRGLARTVSLAILHGLELEHRLAAFVAKGLVPSSYRSEMEKLTRKLHGIDYMTVEMRVNPLLTGAILLDLQRTYLAMGSDTLLVSHFRPLCHIYSALCDRGLLDKIPFLEDVVQAYEASMFTPSRAAATHGSFARSFLASHNLVEATAWSRTGRRPGETKSVVEKATVFYLSPVVRLVDDDDLSVLPEQSSASWTALLSAVAELCAKDLFDSRVLSRDSLTLSGDVIGVTNALCDALGRRPDFERMVRSKSPYRALENAVVFPLLPTLDSLPSNVLSKSAKDALALCRRAAAVISTTFGDPVSNERNYFTFPATSTWMSREFPRSPSQQNSRTVIVSEFKELLKMLKTSRGPLRGVQLETFKRRVAATPAVLTMAPSDPNTELWSLLHHAAAGPAHDTLLAEWLIQMGAIDGQLPFDQNLDQIKQQHPTVRHALAVHCAAKKGFATTVQLMLEASSFRDLNTKTFQTKESLAQIAVEIGDQQLWTWLMFRGAKVKGTDAAGRRIWDLTSDPRWKAELKNMAALQDETSDADEIKKAELLQKEEELRKMQYEVHAEVLANSTSPDAPRNVSENAQHRVPPPATLKNKATMKHASKSTATPSGTAATTNLVGQLLNNGTAQSRGDELKALSMAVSKLKADTFSSTEDREECARSAIMNFSHFADFASNVVTVGVLSRSSAVMCEVQDTAHALILLDDLYTHLRSRQRIRKRSGREITALHALVTPAEDVRFCLFFTVMIQATRLLMYCGMTQLVNEIIAMIERSLLSIKTRSFGFREMMKKYIDARRFTKPNATIASTRKMERQFEWYASDHGIKNKDELNRIDRLYGCAHYMRVKVIEVWSATAFEVCQIAITKATPHGRLPVFLGDEILAGAETAAQLADIVKMVLIGATLLGIKLQFAKEDLDRASVDICGFQFSTAGIARRAPTS